VSGDGIGSSGFTLNRWTRIAFWALLGVVVLVRVRSVFTQSLNWDEFALLQRAVATARTGMVEGGGRPGLATLVLVPLADGCRLAVDALVEARLLWTVIVAAGAAAFWILLRGLLPDSPHRWSSLALGMGLWIMAPAFLLSSTQVRTDQPAFAFALLGGAALVASRCRTSWAAPAGILMATAFLFSQKAGYVLALVGVLAAGQLLVRKEWDLRREAVRVGLAAASFLLILLGYGALIRSMGSSATVVPGAGQFETFRFYEEMVGWREYGQMLPLLVPQLLVLAGLGVVSVDWLRGHRTHGREIVVAWAVLAVGVAVLLFHAGRFSYFYMILGLFPAAIGALVAGPILERLNSFVPRTAFLVVLWVPLSIGAVMVAGRLMVNDLEGQRATLAFVERNFSPEARGYDAVGVFACRDDPDPFPVQFAEHVWALYGGADGAVRGQELIHEFRIRPISFMMLPLETASYPETVREFWETRYVPYFGEIRVPGREMEGPEGWRGSFEVLVPGAYRWRTEGSHPLQVDDEQVDADGIIHLGRIGVRALTLPNGGAGVLVLELTDPPSPGPDLFFRGF